MAGASAPTRANYMLTIKLGPLFETSQKNLRKISYLRTIFDNIWVNTNQT